MERNIFTPMDDFHSSLQDRIAIRSIKKDKDNFFVIYEDDGSYLNYHSYRGWQSYKNEELPTEEREFYEESLLTPNPTRSKTSSKEFKKLIQEKFPDCLVSISNNFGDHIGVSIIRKNGIYTDEIFNKEGTRQEILDELSIKFRESI